MVRRAASNLTDDSLKENSRQAPVSDEKPTRTRRGMLRDNHEQRDEDDEDESQVNNNGGAQGVESDEDANGEADNGEEEEEDGGSPKGRKRARANTLGESRPTDGDFKEKKQAVTLPRDVDGFIPGSIMRIQLKNFVTYDYVEFFPGPHLNMILGPNGTGKSSIACAICIGLNFPTSVLGRASELSAFVKLGTTDGHIEIELKGPSGKPNLVIKRTLQANSKSNQFFLNGRTVSGREVNQRMAELNVQVSNLCSFLPQDKVAEFARMSPQQLLKETQRAAGNENLTAWHDTLITAGKELKALQTTVDSDREQLKTLQERNANLERDVKRYEERRAIEKEIEFLEVLIPVTEYTEAKKRYDQLKEIQTQKQREIKALQQRDAPYMDLSKRLERQITQLNLRRDTKKAAFDEQAEALKGQLDNLKVREKERIKNIQRLKNEIAAIQHQLDNPPKIENIEVINEEMKQLRQENRGIAEKQRDLQDRQRDCIQEESKYKMEMETANRELRQLDDHNSRRLNALRKADKDAAEVVEWLRLNRNRFQKEIIEPPYLSVTVPERRFASAVEACFNWNDLKTFVAQTQEDLATLNRLIVDTPEGLGRRVRINSWFRPQPEIAKPPMSEENLKSLGFDGYASDLIQCPDALRAFLHGTMNLHRTAIAVTSNVDPARAMDAIAHAGGATYIIGTTLNIVSRSRYGQQKAQNQTRNIREAKVFVFADVDPTLKSAAERKIGESRHHLEECKKLSDALSKEDAAINAEIAEFKGKANVLQERKKVATAAYTLVQKHKIDLDRKQENLRLLEERPPVEVERSKLKGKILKCASQRVAILVEYEKLMKDIIASQTEASKVFLEGLQVLAKHTKLKEVCAEREEEVQRALVEFNRIHDQYQAAKDESKAKLHISRAKFNEADDELRERVKGVEQTADANARSVEELNLELETQKRNLELSMHTNPGVVEQYKNRLKAIEQLTQQIEEREEKVAKKERSIKLARDNWEPALNRLVGSVGQKFSEAFDRIGCAGEIKLTPHEDYDKWAIDILVKFRDSEKLQLLTGERQSGGERSLTTIMYLMSLTAEARTPFSLVDEINQGMDSRAERAVHNSLVDVTCKSDSGQYFLITPKLLTDLMYHERMKVLCVNNGEWLPEDSNGLGSMMKMIEGYVSHRSRSSA
ncbi:hypothetical protein QCA50_000716 [Cerrena zonata]|uniref:Structural maintenance of chromosomes protein 5 n=1 Tax=Cerrena zonata TaxID=2478898 RepID=A0AAW0GVG7_9APHY